MLDNNGFIDTYRTLYPDVLNYPGFHFSRRQSTGSGRKLTWTPKSDERDRIDYVFYYPYPAIELKDAVIFGPQGSMVKSQRTSEKSKDNFYCLKGYGLQTQKGLLVTF